MPKKATKKRVPMYEVSIRVLGKDYKAKAAKLSDAIEKLGVGYGARGMSVLCVKKGKESRQKILSSIATQRLFGPKGSIVKDVVMKQTLQMFDI